MLKKERAIYILNRLEELYPNTPIPLKNNNTFELLIAVLLSAQSTDDRVNQVTPKLFSIANNPYEMSKLDTDNIYEIIKPCGLGPQKSSNILELSKILVKKYSGNVPDNFIDLEELPGVGHKTASVVMSQGFGHPAFPVDTHIHRCAQRWGLSSGKNVKTTENDLKKLFPEKEWNKLHIQIIMYARNYCPARGCFGLECSICKTCFPNRKSKFKHKKP